MLKIKYIFICLLIIIISCNPNKAETSIVEIIELDKLEYVEIQLEDYNYIGYESPHWKLYKIINEKYSSETIEKEYYKTKSII
jgi:hypothetical protein